VIPIELNLLFPDPEHVLVSLRRESGIEAVKPQAFAPPLDQKTREDLTWYLETYPVLYTTEVDDVRAAGIAASLKDWGGALFNSVFASRAADRLYEKFYASDEPRLLTVSSLHQSVLAQPWELLCDPDGTFLFLDNPRIPIRRHLDGTGRTPYRPKPKDRLHLLFVVSRPEDEGFFDPRADPMAIMDAIDTEAPGKVTVEFLRPPTLPKLRERLTDRRLPSVDILHFDGHGKYDSDGRLAERLPRALGAGRAADLLRDVATAAHHGYLLFEDPAHNSDPVPAPILGDLLWKKRVGLVMLCACQSAMIGDEDPLGSVAPQLIRAGIPSVLAMTQSVLVATTRALGGHFYRELAAGQPIGEALDAARSGLFFEPKRGEQQRDSGTKDLTLQDWFVPALYQTGADGALLTPSDAKTGPPAAPTHNLPDAQETGFFGRCRELHDIERWFVDGTRRIVLTGFGGQGKTALALEAGRWLLRTGLFERVCFVSYAGFPGSDPVQLAVSNLATVLDTNLPNTQAAGTAMAERATLLILDNLDSLEGETREKCLTAASAWSKQGRSRVLITARSGELLHADYPAEGSNLCRHLEITGLTPQDALKWFHKLLALSPKPSLIPTPDAAKELLAQVKFHPLSISVLAPVLRRLRSADVGEALRDQLSRADNPLTASLNLSLNLLDATSQTALIGFGVFVSGGALERALLAILEINEPQWRRLRDVLSQARLVEIETTPLIDGAFIRFHPTLAQEMRLRLSLEHLERLSERYRQCYFSLACSLHEQMAGRQNQQAVLWMARRELSNLCAAANATLDRAEPTAARFANSVAQLMTYFGRSQDGEVLLKRAASSFSVPGSEEWWDLQAVRGEQLLKQGQYAEAERVFEELLGYVDDSPSLRRCFALRISGVCKVHQKLLEPAEAILRHALREAGTLQRHRDVRSLVSAIHYDLGELLINRGDPNGAQVELEAALTIVTDLRDQAGLAAIYGSLAHLFLKRTDLSRQERCVHAEKYVQAALTIFKDLDDSRSIATGYHQLGVIHLEAGALSQAERDFREAALHSDTIGDWLAAGQSWMNLANVCSKQKQSMAQVELWYRKALSAFDRANDVVSKGVVLDNLARLLQQSSERLDEARDLAEEALALKQHSDQHVSEIAKTLELLAFIALRRRDHVARVRYATALRQISSTLPAGEGARFVKEMIPDIRGALQHTEQRPALEQKLELIFRGSSDMLAAMRAILDGERDEAVLCENLALTEAFMIRVILAGLSDPTTPNENSRGA
jgi:tetratricopeptide (TPR) repeat protein